MGARDSLPIIRRTLRMLDAVAGRREGMTFNEIRTLFPDAPASTVSRMLKTLLEEGLLDKAESARNYRLGHAAERLAQKICGRLERGEVLRPLVEELARSLDHSCAYFELRQQAATLVVKCEVPDGYHYMPEGGSHARFLRHGGAKMLLAHQSKDLRDELLERLSDLRRKDRPAFHKELDAIRTADVWLSRRDDPEHIARVIAPVFDGRGFSGIFVATLPGTYDNDAFDEISDKVRKAAVRASKLLSGLQ